MSMRLLPRAGEWIDRSRKVKFTFEGKEYEGYAGDTMTTALWANGEKVLGRSFKYHRPRGVLSLANHDINVMLTDGEDTNIRGDVTPITDGMQLAAVNTDGGVKRDRKRFIDAISSLLPVGFYYKAFHTPRSLFPFWERVIRNSAGLGVVNFAYPRHTKPKLHSHCDVLVIGAGPSGLMAAITVAGQGLKVVVADENHQAGGSLGYDHAADQASQQYLADLLHQVGQLPNITLQTGTYAAGYYADHLIPLVGQHGITKVRARAVIVASGAFEQPPVFRNNDLPGVMLSTAAQRLIARYAIKPCSKAVVVTANAQGYRAALDLLDASVEIAAIVDLRAAGESGPLVKSLMDRGARIIHGSCVYEVLPSSGKIGVDGVIVTPFDEISALPDIGRKETIACDGVIMSAGWAPAAALLYQAGTAMRFDQAVQQFVPNRLPKGVFAAGKVNGVFDLGNRMLDGKRAANEALAYLGAHGAEPVVVGAHTGSSPSHAYPVVDHPQGKNFVDFDEDISVKDFIHAAQEGFDNIELMKRFTTVGMGPSQGKHSNMNAIRILARIRQLPVEKIGTTTARPFFHPTPIGHLAGRSFHPHRETALHGWHAAHGAEFVDVGVWKRPAYYAIAGLTKLASIHREVAAVRASVGLIDVSTLGKIEVRGPDAAEFLERIYTGNFKDQRIGRSRYALMLDEAGVMVDDGIAARIAEDYFYITAGTSNGAAVYREMQRWQQIWQLNIGLVNVTGAYGAINIAGPDARAVLAKLTQDSLDEANLAFGAVRDIEVAGMKARVMRVGFVSQLAFEIHVPYGSTQHVWESLLVAGSAMGIVPFGTDAQRLLRLEMGNPLIGHDTDGLTNPLEADAEFAIQMEKPFFIGKRSLEIIARRPITKRLVPFVLASEYRGEVPFECNLVIGPQGNIEGRVTSIAWSPTVARHIGFAYVDPLHAGVGSTFTIRADSGALVHAEVVTTPFISPQEGA